MRNNIILPVKVQNNPHWRVNIRPERYDPDLIQTLKKCLSIIEKSKVRLRGWDYPYLSIKENERIYGSKWIASWTSYDGHNEYWRYYQSGQFIHLFAVREATKPGWKEILEKQSKSHLSHIENINWKKVPGYFSLVNSIYTITEIFEFAARLVGSQIYSDILNIKIEIFGIKDFILTTDFNRGWSEYYKMGDDIISNEWRIEKENLLANSSIFSLKAINWFFERFGWLEQNNSIIEKIQSDFLKGVL